MRDTVIGIVLALGLLGALFFAARLNPHVPAAAVSEQAFEQAAAQIKPGFVGMKTIGAWQVICQASDAAAPPQKPPAAPPAAPAAAEQQSQPAAMPLSLSASGSAAPAGTESADTMPTPHAAAGTTASTASALPASPAPAVMPPPAPAPAISLGRCRAALLYRSKKNPKQVLVAIGFRLVGKAHALALIVRMPSIAKKGDMIVLRIGKAGLKLPVRDCGKEGCLAAGVLAPDSQAGLLSAEQGELMLPASSDGKLVRLPVPLAGLSAAIAALHRAES